MPERTTIAEGTQIGIEATPGTAVAAGKRLRSVSFEFDPDFNTRAFKPQGNKFPALVIPGKESVGGNIGGAGDYNEIIYPLAMAFGAPVTTTPVGATTARQHVFTVLPSGIQDGKSATIEIGSATRAERSTFVLATDFGVTINRDEINLSGAIVGRRVEDGVTLTAAPAVVGPLAPIIPEHVSVYLDTTFAGIGGTKLLRVLETAHSVSSRFGTLWPLDAAQSSYVSAYEVDPDSEATLIMAADAAGMANLTRARTGDVAYLRIEAVGPIIEAAVAYKYRVDLPVKVTDWGYGDRDGLKTAEFTFDWTDDATAAFAAQFTVVNKVTAL